MGDGGRLLLRRLRWKSSEGIERERERETHTHDYEFYILKMHAAAVYPRKPYTCTSTRRSSTHTFSHGDV